MIIQKKKLNFLRTRDSTLELSRVLPYISIQLMIKIIILIKRLTEIANNCLKFEEK